MKYEEHCLDLKYPIQGTCHDKEMSDCLNCERTFTVTDEFGELCPECEQARNFMRSISKN